MRPPVVVLGSPRAGELRFYRSEWERVVGLARMFGWIPKGRPVGRRVSEEEALELAEALERGLLDVPRSDVVAARMVPDPEHPGRMILPPGESMSAFEYFAGHGRSALEAVVGFARAGGGFELL